MKLDDITSVEHKEDDFGSARHNRMRRFFNIQDHVVAQREQSPHLTDPTANHGEPVVANRQLVRTVNRALGDQLRLQLDSNGSSCFISHQWLDTGPFKRLTPAYISSTHRLSVMHHIIPQLRCNDSLTTQYITARFMNTSSIPTLVPTCCCPAGLVTPLPIIRYIRECLST